MDMPSVMARVDDWQDHLPRVQAYYALRCNADPVLARMLADCAQLGFAVSDAQQLAMVGAELRTNYFTSHKLTTNDTLLRPSSWFRVTESLWIVRCGLAKR